MASSRWRTDVAKTCMHPTPPPLYPLTLLLDENVIFFLCGQAFFLKKKVFISFLCGRVFFFLTLVTFFSLQADFLGGFYQNYIPGWTHYNYKSTYPGIHFYTALPRYSLVCNLVFIKTSRADALNFQIYPGIHSYKFTSYCNGWTGGQSG